MKWSVYFWVGERERSTKKEWEKVTNTIKMGNIFMKLVCLANLFHKINWIFDFNFPTVSMSKKTILFWWNRFMWSTMPTYHTNFSWHSQIFNAIERKNKDTNNTKDIFAISMEFFVWYFSFYTNIPIGFGTLCNRLTIKCTPWFETQPSTYTCITHRLIDRFWFSAFDHSAAATVEEKRNKMVQKVRDWKRAKSI